MTGLRVVIIHQSSTINDGHDFNALFVDQKEREKGADDKRSSMVATA